MNLAVQSRVIASDAPPDTSPLDWNEVRRRFDEERWYWLATSRPDGRAHLRPVLAVAIDDRIYSTTSPAALKGKNLARLGWCSVAARAPALDIVVEGRTAWIDDRKLLETIGAAYGRKYGWPVTVTPEGLFDAPYGAPTAGPPPYAVYEITPASAYAFGTDNQLGVRSTRFRFA